MLRARNAALIAVIGVLTVTIGGSGDFGVRAPAAQALPRVILRPGVLSTVQATSAPPTTATCERQLMIACYSPTQIQRAYRLPGLFERGITGAGATIVVVDPFGSPTVAHDLAVFDKQFGIPAPPSLSVIQPAGAVPPFDPADSTMVGWAGETSLDVEYAHAVAPGAKILLVETPVAETEGVTGFPQIVRAEKFVIDHHLGDVISQSFSATEETFPSRAAVQALREAYIDAYRHHVTVLADSGDTGAAGVGLDGTTFFTAPVTSWPGSDPLVTAVGGTELRLNADGERIAPDTVWNDTGDTAVNELFFGDAGPNPDAGGGGLSVLFSRPGYQDGVRNVVGTRRGVPDIAMSAGCDGAVLVFESFGGQSAGWHLACGTSEATPLFAGIVALADQVAGHPLGLINPALYRMSARGLPGIVDVTEGDNTVSFLQNGHFFTVPGFGGASGYSLAAGVGTLDAPLFVPELAAFARTSAPPRRKPN